MSLEPVTLDARGLKCPMPLLKAKQALNGMAAGQELVIEATDPGSVRDFEAFTRQSGHELVSSVVVSGAEGDVYAYRLRKKAG